MILKESKFVTNKAVEIYNNIQSKLEKAFAPPVPVGTKKQYNGHWYVKTIDGWKSASGEAEENDDFKNKEKKKVVKPKKKKYSEIETAPYK